MVNIKPGQFMELKLTYYVTTYRGISTVSIYFSVHRIVIYIHT